MERIESSFLPGICCPRFTAVEQSTYNTCIVYCNFGFGSELWVFPHSRREAGKSGCCLSDSLVNLSVQRNVAADGGAEIGELIHSLKLVVVHTDLWLVVCALSNDIYFDLVFFSPLSLM